MTVQIVNKETALDFLIDALAKMLEVDISDIDADIAFDRYGIDSAQAVVLTGELSDWSGVELEPTLLYDYPTINTLSDYLTQQTA